MTEEQMRREFEEWALSNEGPSVSVMRNEVGRYEDEELNMAWLGWQSAQSVPVVGEPAGYFPDESRADEIDAPPLPVYFAPTHSIPAAELATLREKAAMADELRKDAEIAVSTRNIALNALQEIIDIDYQANLADAKLAATKAMAQLAAIAQGKGE